MLEAVLPAVEGDVKLKNQMGAVAPTCTLQQGPQIGHGTLDGIHCNNACFLRHYFVAGLSVNENTAREVVLSRHDFAGTWSRLGRGVSETMHVKGRPLPSRRAKGVGKTRQRKPRQRHKCVVICCKNGDDGSTT